MIWPFTNDIKMLSGMDFDRYPSNCFMSQVVHVQQVNVIRCIIDMIYDVKNVNLLVTCVAVYTSGTKTTLHKQIICNARSGFCKPLQKKSLIIPGILLQLFSIRTNNLSEHRKIYPVSANGINYFVDMGLIIQLCFKLIKYLHGNLVLISHKFINLKFCKINLCLQYTNKVLAII